MVPGLLGVIVIVTVPPAAGGKLPKLQVTMPALLAQVPAVLVAETKVVPAGKASVSMAFEAVDGPLLVTAMV